MSLLDIADT